VLQNALVRLGATDLAESDRVLPSNAHADLSEVIREVLARGDARFLVVLAPVLVRHADALNLRKLYADLREAGFEKRFAWVVQNTLEAIDQEVGSHPPRKWLLLCKRAHVVFDAFLEAIEDLSGARPDALDILERGIRSKETVKELTETWSAASRRWRIVSSVQPSDFAKSLRAANVED
jgi:hypothetical protein